MKKILLAFALLFAMPVLAQGYFHRSNPGSPGTSGGAITSAGSGNCPGTGCFVLSTQGTTTMTAIISGTWSATLQFTCSNDMWVTTTPIAADTFASGTMSGAPATTTTANGTFIAPTFGFRECGLFATAFTSNTSMAIRLDADPSPAVPIGATGAAAVQFQGTTPDGSALLGNPLSEGLGFNGVNRVPRYCDKIAAFTTLATTAVIQQVAGVASQNIWVCGYQMSASTATAGTTLQWVEGTGANCATGQANVGGVLVNATPTAAPGTPNLVFGPSNPALPYTATAGDSLCLKQGQAVNSTAVNGILFYTQN